MANKVEKSDDAAAIVEHFKALPFEQQESVLEDIQALMRQQAAEQLPEAERRLAYLRRLAGTPEASAHLNAGARRARGPRSDKEAKYRSKKDPNLTSPGGGRDPKWLMDEMAETGLPKEAFLIDAQ